MHISSQFDGGNIRCLAAEDPSDIRLEIVKDNQSDFYQWFFFRLTGAKDRECVMRIQNAGGAAYPGGFKDYRAVASYDRESWFRIETEFDGKELTLRHKPLANSLYFAYFAPYSVERHMDLIADTLAAPSVDVMRLGQTLDGQDLDLLRIGEPEGDKLKCWIIGRQHPGETMAEWWMEGFLDKLLDEDEPVSRELLKRAVFYVVPNMNPDGSRRGHLRTNAAGANLNREWLKPTMERSPEVFLVRQKMHEVGVDFFLDVHGDEALPYNFIAGAEGIASWSEERQALQDAYEAALVLASPDFQTEHGYEPDAPGSANLAKATDYVAETFGCLAMTLEMPFKDTVETPNELEGWSPERCRRLGAANLNAIYAMRERLT
ncbi:Peptidase-M14 domain-containing protein [Sulfidibacter corallicola]|uniref:Peptidase M14 domain-containing protein n=1 Tax=Sulfidibacter corallicola TaxID=2818388 RepID=A0A8A4TKB8_SULCO|nr:M14-type cytosolic carboxypeptidase [Sulfidibacter corallicola]QTD50386.1 hypothetical protein J3U87_32785 [Sulfidibacter corallicola]